MLHVLDHLAERDRPAVKQPQRQALAQRRHVPALDRGRDARGRAPVPSRQLPALAVAVAVERDIARHTLTNPPAPEVAATAV
jgi:hypothetical protein